MYNRVGFTVRYVIIDGKFRKVKEHLPTIVCSITSTKEHISEADIYIRVFMEKNWGLVNTVSFSNMPKIMYIEFIYLTLLCLNAFLVRSNVL